MVKKTKCNHDNRLPVYGRDEKNWISSLKIRGEMVFICEDCGEVFAEKKKITKHDVLVSGDDYE